MFANLPANEIDEGYLSWDDLTVQQHIENLLWSPWYSDADGFLYIVSLDGVFGPDNEIEDALAQAMREGANPEHLDDIVDVEHVNYSLHRFNTIVGFHYE